MRPLTVRLLASVLAIALGTPCLDLLPPLGVSELLGGVAVLIVGSRAAYAIALVPTALILATAIEIMAAVSGPANPIMLAISLVAAVTAAVLLRCVGIGRHRDAWGTRTDGFPR